MNRNHDRKPLPCMVCIAIGVPQCFSMLYSTTVDLFTDCHKALHLLTLEWCLYHFEMFESWSLPSQRRPHFMASLYYQPSKIELIEISESGEHKCSNVR